jgi:hypothetical protein
MESFTGACELCGLSASRAGIRRHSAKCAPQHDSGPQDQALIQLFIEASRDPVYWLYLEAQGQATLEDVDSLLRTVWLECCGHMSAFWVRDGEAAMGAPLGRALPTKGLKFRYEYDFGSTTRLTGKVVALRQGSIGRHAVRLLARNAPPKLKCSSCGAPAELACPFCSHGGPSLFCMAHAPAHSCAGEGAFLPIVNSPRTGVCGYSG